jgi:serine/threonine protein kinase
VLPYPLSFFEKCSKIQIVEQLYYRKLLFELQDKGLPWGKASRSKFPFLRRSIWYNQHGHIYEQYHAKSFTTAYQITMVGDDKHFKGRGEFKRVWELKSLYPKAEWPKMVRARLLHAVPSSYNMNRLRIANLRRDVTDERLLLPHFVSYSNSKDKTVYAQVMPLVEGGSLEVAIAKKLLSLHDKLRIAIDICKALIALHAHGWGHRDVKPDNIMVCNQELIAAKLTDFDFSLPFSSKKLSSYESCSPIYADPQILQHSAAMVDFPKQHDQFAYGATLYQLFVGTLLRGNATEMSDLIPWVTESDLYADDTFRMINPVVQYIIRCWCVGEIAERPYRLPEFLRMLEEVIAELAAP